MLLTVKILLGLTDTSKDQLLTLLINNMKQRVMNYCNITSIPASLESIIAEMVVALYKDQYGYVTSAGQSQAPVVSGGSLKAVTIGDYREEYNVSGTTSSSTPTAATSAIMNDFSSQLNQFRKVKFI